NVPAAATNVIAVTSGYNHSLALRADGTVVAWGWNEYDQCDVPAGLTNVIAIAAGNKHSVALRADGTVVGWGLYLFPLKVPDNLPAAAAIASGYNHCLALVNDDRPYCVPPFNRTVLQGADAAFAVRPAGFAPFHFQWLFNGADIPGATNSTYLITNVQPGREG